MSYFFNLRPFSRLLMLLSSEVGSFPPAQPAFLISEVGDQLISETGDLLVSD